jgi:hypothetical protein
MRQTAEAVSVGLLEAARLSAAESARLGATALHEVNFEIGLATVAVRFNRESAAGLLARRFRDVRGKGQAKVTLYAVDRGDDALLWVTPESARRWPRPVDDELLAFFADNVAISEYLGLSNDFGLHAAAISHPAGVIALAGPSGAGKTTTAIAAARAGFGFYSDEYCIMQGGLVVPFPRALTTRVGGRAALRGDGTFSAIDARLRLLADTGDVSVCPRQLLGELTGGPPRPLSAVFVIEGRGERPSATACPMYALLPELVRSTLNGARNVDRAAGLLAALRNARGYRLRLGTPAATAALLANVCHVDFVTSGR